MPVGLAEAIPIEIETGEVTVIEGIALFAAFLGEIAVIFIGLVFYSGAVGGLVLGRLRRERTSLATLLRRLPYGRLAAIDVLVTLGTGIGLLLLVVPGLLFLTLYCMAAPVAEMERRGIGAAMSRSRELVRGHLPAVAAAVVPVWLLTTAVEAGLEALGTSIGGESVVADWISGTLALTLMSPLYALTVADVTVELALLKSGGAWPEARGGTASG